MEGMRWFDRHILRFLGENSAPMARIALFVVFFWFGILKVFAFSPASQMVSDLLAITMPFMESATFLVWFGVFEVLIGILFLIPRAERAAILVLGVHLVMTSLPLLLMPAHTWSAWFVPTLEGQYIIKNVLIIALAFPIAGHIQHKHPREKIGTCLPAGRN
ncbi:MAG: hypothetical protein COU11_02180 [Candidatus Harrisonbacteria bacterium CG10_big_fil_rev_8_21_14_0_10_49_15]|uniref:DoxX family protein n=1 Tax=Candidatus Harrisonbacteria bacterium CG10_big_fil_rev_8_21_14_0_10_49_15 TaxID=1974587 RepID=A0A2H0UMW3_9BACT|nr:MAG: hypothetical protein COU11_02180 [Candidatus Harrisonbacteria bacterium CG10_big_fil_rev_8_21_14_0_10_49_15]